MQWRLGSRALMAAALAASMAACDQNNSPTAVAPRGATVAFESIDGPPQAQFRTLVQNLSDEAQSRRLAVISREQPAVYRVRGYLATHVVKGQTTVSWVWDVFDKDENRALRIEGEETGKGQLRDAWNVADAAMLKRIAHTSMDQLAAFLTSPDVVPNAAPAAAEATLVSTTDSSPEAAGIVRIPQAKVDPRAGGGGAPSASLSANETLSLSAARR